jgi:outer membrane protein assembly factor BamB
VDEREPSSVAGIYAASRRRAPTLIIIGIAIVVLAAGVLWRANASDSSSSAPGTGCAEDPGGPSALVGFDASTGALRWSRRIGGELAGVAQVHDVIASIGLDGKAIGVDGVTGAVKWCRDLGAAPSGGTLSFQLGFVPGTDVLATLTGNGHVVGLDPMSGATRWDTAITPPEGGSLVGGALIYVKGIPVMPAIEAPSSVPDSSGGSSSNAPPPSMPATIPPVITAVLDSNTGRIINDPPAPPSKPTSAAGELITNSVYSPTRQEMTVGVRDPASGAERWSKLVPGFTASITDDAVLVIDQTGGTGDATSFPTGPGEVETTLTAYAAGTGDPVWHVSLPGTPNQPFAIGERIVIANGPQIFSIDAKTGAIVWSVDHGSPGVTNRYSEPGGYTWFEQTSSDSITGLIAAAEPYRD